MSKYIIVADSCMDLNKEQRAEYGVERPIPGGVVYPDGSDHLADIDWETITFEEFYRRLDKKEVFKSSYPNPTMICETLEPHLKNGEDVIAVTLSGGMSGTYDAFMSAKQTLEEQYKGRKVLVIDSRRYSGAISLLCVLAAINREKGMSVEENFAVLSEKRKCIHQIGLLDNLFFLARSGRISKTKAFFGTMASVKPMADFSNETGMPTVLGNARGYKAAYKHMEAFMRALISKKDEDQIIVVSHSIREEQANKLVEIAHNVAPKAKVLLTRVSQSNGVNVGPGLVVAFFLSEKPVSKDCEEERKLIADILAKK